MLKICLVFWKSEPQYAYKCYAYKKNMYYDWVLLDPSAKFWETTNVAIIFYLEDEYLLTIRTLAMLNIV